MRPGSPHRTDDGDGDVPESGAGRRGRGGAPERRLLSRAGAAGVPQRPQGVQRVDRGGRRRAVDHRSGHPRRPGQRVGAPAHRDDPTGACGADDGPATGRQRRPPRRRPRCDVGHAEPVRATRADASSCRSPRHDRDAPGGGGGRAGAHARSTGHRVHRARRRPGLTRGAGAARSGSDRPGRERAAVNAPARRSVAALAGALLLVSLGGCASADLAPTAAEQLQAAVDDVVTAAEQGRYEDAVAAAAEVRAALESAADDGRLSVDRYRTIEDALTRTEAELTAVIQAADGAGQETTPATETPGDAKNPGDRPTKDNGHTPGNRDAGG